MTYHKHHRPTTRKLEQLTLSAVNDATSVWFVTITLVKDGPLTATTVCGRFAADWTAEENEAVLDQADEEISCLFGTRAPSESQSYLFAILTMTDGRVNHYALAAVDNHPRSGCFLALDDAIKAAASYARVAAELMID